ncbi:hypothetical protein CEXT_229291 [Caerostris extrusa]|uniref:Uncharacterized protein n=1 Tax=Caerostris extrusa TaxID=172846 RepID=A0AAV4NPY4_CAEEX|nr:hypothetical protein CEXT_229291 [Caerostris extrusa]
MTPESQPNYAGTSGHLGLIWEPDAESFFERGSLRSGPSLSRRLKQIDASERYRLGLLGIYSGGQFSACPVGNGRSNETFIQFRHLV